MSEQASTMATGSALGLITIAVSGSRGIDNEARVYEILDSEAISYVARGYIVNFRLGDAIGVDWIARKWANELAMLRTICFADRKGYDAWQKGAQLRDFSGPGVELGVLASDWDRDGVSAGPIRNQMMIAGGKVDADDRLLVPPMGRADLLVAIYDGTSPGTRNAMATARNHGVFIHQWGGGGPVEFKPTSVKPLDERQVIEFKGTV